MGNLAETFRESTIDDGELFYESDAGQRLESLASLHPAPYMLSKLREVYLDRVDPLLKVLHFPTFWSAATGALQHPQALSKSLEALMFAFYLAAGSALQEDECYSVFGMSQQALLSRYRVAARRALINARFLSTSSPNTLRAFVLFMVSEHNLSYLSHMS